jgi:hypothetical protein
MASRFHSSLKAGALILALAPFQAFAQVMDKVVVAQPHGEEFKTLQKVHDYEKNTAQAFGMDVLRPLDRPSYGWFWGLDTALRSWLTSPEHQSKPPAYTLSPALDRTYWERSAVDENKYDVSLFSDRVDEWLATGLMLGAPQPVPSPAVVLTGPVTSNLSHPLVKLRRTRNLVFSDRVKEFIRKTVKENGNPLTLYVPVKASRGTGVAHYILAVVRIGARKPGMDPKKVPMELDFYDSLMSGRTTNFSPSQETDFAKAFQEELRPLVGEEAAFTGPIRYLQVQSQMPSTTWCGRFVTLYFLADVLHIPYDEWYQERFTKVLPSFMGLLDRD